MVIEEIRLRWARLPFVEPFRISSGAVTEKDGIVVTVRADGLLGQGESSPMAGAFYSADTPEGCWRELCDVVRPALLGKRFDSLAEASAAVAGLAVSPFSKAGVETALWDLEAQRVGAPLHRLLGGLRDRVESGLAVGLYERTADLLRAVERHLADGYKRVKIKIEPGRDVELVSAVRAVFPDVPLFVDANAAYTIADLDVFRRLDDFGLLMFEQPLAAAALEDSAALQRQVRTPVCLDESLTCLARLDRAAALGSLRVANIKIQRVGGFTAALALYRRCIELGLGVWIGTMPELGIGCAHGAALAALEGCGYPTDVEASLRWFRDDIVAPLIEVRDGFLQMPSASGLGWRLDEAKLSRYLVAEA